MNINYRGNAYAQTVTDIDAPKTVWTAIAVSLALQLAGNGNIDDARQRILDEWIALHANGIVPQKPRKRGR